MLTKCYESSVPWEAWFITYGGGGLQCFLVGCYSKLCCHPCCMAETWDLIDGRVYSTVNHHVWCGLSGRVRGEMPAKCSHHDLMRWFSCSSVPSAVLCNSETPTPQYPWPACVTSAFVHIRHVAHNAMKHVERLLWETGVQWAVNQCGVCGLKMGGMGRAWNGYREKGIAVSPTFVGERVNLPIWMQNEYTIILHAQIMYISFSRTHAEDSTEQAFLLPSVLVAQQCCSWQRLVL